MPHRIIISPHPPIISPSHRPTIQWSHHPTVPPSNHYSIPPSHHPTVPPSNHSFHPPSVPPSLCPTLPPSHRPTVAINTERAKHFCCRQSGVACRLVSSGPRFAAAGGIDRSLVAGRITSKRTAARSAFDDTSTGLVRRLGRLIKRNAHFNLTLAHACMQQAHGKQSSTCTHPRTRPQTRNARTRTYMKHSYDSGMLTWNLVSRLAKCDVTPIDS